jgi:type VI secretion system protein ImpL
MKKPVAALAIAILIVWLSLSWFIPIWLHLGSPAFWILRIALIVIGLIGFAGFLWLGSRAERGSSGSSTACEDIDLAFADAQARIKSANLNRRRIAAFPVVLLLGDTGSAKTTTILGSGLEPELLAGQAFSGDNLVPTRALNIWLTRQTIVADPGGMLLRDRAGRLRLASQLAPSPAGAVRQATTEARAVVVCVDCEDFLKPKAAESLAAKARELREQLGELGTALGVRLPVYVLFTKMDRLQYFFDYVASLDSEEAQQVFGVTLPFARETGSGVYAEQETRRLTETFSTLYCSLSDRRSRYLAREHDSSKLPSIYEFPREFRKIRPLVVQFLVDLCRPSQLQANPFLRGFYFTGVRPITVAEAPVAKPVAAPSSEVFNPEATRVFRQPRQSMVEVESSAPGTRRVPQWTYLSHFFPEVVLADRPALATSAKSFKTSRARRVFLIALAILGIFLAAVWTISFLSNYSLAIQTRNACRSAAQAQIGPDGSVSLQALRNLQEAQNNIELLSNYEREGPPLRFRWGLYSGTALYDPMYRAWFGGFRRVLLAPAQRNLIQVLSAPANSADGHYRSVYDALKAYLITTSHPEKSTRQFLPPVLLQYWQEGKTIERTRVAYATGQLNFYSDELRRRTPWPYVTAPDEDSVGTARSYLNNQLAATDALYEAILSRANQQPAIIFNRMYPGSDRVVSNTYVVPAAFTKSGWKLVQDAIQNVSSYFKGEEWVLGPDAFTKVNKGQLQQELANRYRADFTRIWREFLRRTSVVPFGSISDAATKLATLSGNQSPLLEALCVASENTSVDTKAIADVFQPPQQMTPPGCKDHLSAPANDSYIQSLINLQASIGTLGAAESNDSLRTDALTKAAGADVAVAQLARNFAVDKGGGVDTTTRNLLQAPIKYVQVLLAGVPKQEANGAARAFCSQFNSVIRKYPFAAAATQIATLNELGDIFKPNDGALWKLYQDNLQKSLNLVGTTFSPRPGATPNPNPAFISFLNRAAAVSDAFYHGAAQPQLVFGLRVSPSEDVQSVTLSINGQTLNYSPSNTGEQHFTWPSNGPQEAKLRVKFTGGSEFDYPAYSGTWAVFRFFSDSEHWQSNPPEYTFEKPLRTSGGLLTVPGTSRPATARFVLDMGTTAPILRPGYFDNLVCVPVALR